MDVLCVCERELGEVIFVKGSAGVVVQDRAISRVRSVVDTDVELVDVFPSKQWLQGSRSLGEFISALIAELPEHDQEVLMFSYCFLEKSLTLRMIQACRLLLLRVYTRVKIQHKYLTVFGLTFENIPFKEAHSHICLLLVSGGRVLANNTKRTGSFAPYERDMKRCSMLPSRIKRRSDLLEVNLIVVFDGHSRG